MTLPQSPKWTTILGRQVCYNARHNHYCLLDREGNEVEYSGPSMLCVLRVIKGKDPAKAEAEAMERRAAHLKRVAELTPEEREPLQLTPSDKAIVTAVLGEIAKD